VIPSPPEGVRDWPLIGTQLHDLWEKASNNLAVTFREIAPHLNHSPDQSC